jgi:hypothetical protein
LGLVRFQDQYAKGKGKDKATDIISLFMYTGWVYDDSLNFDPE